jgi:putative DNA primase/helicase
MITFCVNVDYDPGAACPRWEAFLGEIFRDNAELVGFMHRLTGYGITGSTDEQCFVVLYGKGANGKSVFTDTLTHVFGEITQTTRFATFEEKPGGAIPNDLAALRNARLVMASEGKAGRVMDESVLKSVTGKDKVTARFLHKEFFSYSPQFLIMLATNHKPNFISQDEGMWRRVKLVPFTRWFAPHERDYDLDRKLKAEAEGIAAWAVRGAIEWYANGLGDPKVIINETREYRETSDSLAGFFPGVLNREDGARLDGTTAYNEYQAWCEEEGLRGKDVKSRTLFYRMMEERGVSRRKSSSGVVLEGVKLTASRDVTMTVGK